MPACLFDYALMNKFYAQILNVVGAHPKHINILWNEVLFKYQI